MLPEATIGIADYRGVVTEAIQADVLQDGCLLEADLERMLLPAWVTSLFGDAVFGDTL